MLQWLGEDFNSSIIFNDYLDDKLVSVEINLESNTKKIYHKPIYSMHQTGNLAISIDFERHHWCRRGYSYDGNFDENKNRKIVENDAIWLINLKLNSSKKIILLQDIININPLTNM
ncbi:uncharacterized protein METZ01_LOCUS262306, partial [marine metagenome]